MKKINNKGFTLIEVLAVVVIIGLLGLIAIPSVISSINRSKESSFAILVKDIKTGSQQMFEEIENVGSTLYHYDSNGKTNDEIVRNYIIGNANKKYIIVNLQTLVSNGFLTGTNHVADEKNGNSKVILSPIDSEDLGECKITITKTVDRSNNYKTTYSFTDLTNNGICPTTEDYKS